MVGVAVAVAAAAAAVTAVGGLAAGRRRGAMAGALRGNGIAARPPVTSGRDVGRSIKAPRRSVYGVAGTVVVGTWLLELSHGSCVVPRHGEVVGDSMAGRLALLVSANASFWQSPRPRARSNTRQV